MGVFEQVHRAPPHPDPNLPLLRIHGRAVMSAVEVKLRLPGERGSLDTQAAHRAQQRALRDERVQMRHERQLLKEQRRLLKEQRRLEDGRRRG